MQNVKDRIRELMTALGLTRQQFTDMTGISPASLSNIFNEKSKPTLNHVQAISAALPGVNTGWLVSGAGEMFLPGASPLPDAGDGFAPAGGRTVSNTAEPDLFSQPAPQPAPKPAPGAVIRARNSGEKTPEAASDAVVSPSRETDAPAAARVRRVTEIRIFYDDQTWETFVPGK